MLIIITKPYMAQYILCIKILLHTNTYIQGGLETATGLKVLKYTVMMKDGAERYDERQRAERCKSN